MARERMITRTVDVTTVDCITMNIETVESGITKYELSGVYADETQLLKTLKKLYETDTFKVVAVKSQETKEVLYGMSEIDFIKIAKVLPPRNKSANADSEDDDSIEE